MAGNDAKVGSPFSSPPTTRQSAADAMTTTAAAGEPVAALKRWEIRRT